MIIVSQDRDEIFNMDQAEKVLKKIITTYKDRIPDENTVFYIPKEEE